MNFNFEQVEMDRTSIYFRKATLNSLRDKVPSKKRSQFVDEVVAKQLEAMPLLTEAKKANGETKQEATPKKKPAAAVKKPGAVSKAKAAKKKK